MAKQHFYSRVPARVSMYNRSDGYDTFAHSDGLGRDFIERELSAVYENRLGKNDMDAARRGEIPSVYSQCKLKSGALVQTCVSYLPLDYTGERSAYLAHSLILSEEEKDVLFLGSDNAVMTPEMFVRDMSSFKIGTPDAAPDKNYPEAEYSVTKAKDIASIFEDYHTEATQGLVFSILSALFAKGKSVFFRLPYKDTELSDKALEFICGVMSILPYHVRKELSFATYVKDPTQYSSYKLKCLSEDCPDIPAAKGVTIDFITSNYAFPSYDESVPYRFFCSMLKNEELRREFLAFTANAVKALPNLEKPSMKTLSDLVFLFSGASGLFDQSKILYDDVKVYDFLCVYDKYRSALNEDYRKKALGCLERYPSSHQAIPKNILTKLSRIYPAEQPAVKRVAMDAVLGLIHTDIMRDKLFNFIKNNYSSEEPEIKAHINEDLCRVFYGGFLQSQILNFFSEHFNDEPEETQNIIFAKLLLTIRTEAIQPKILAFIDAGYHSFTDKQKRMFYEMFYEMLPECDSLAHALVSMVNRIIESESESIRGEVTEALKKLFADDMERREPRLIPVLLSARGFCSDTVISLVFNEERSEKAFEQYTVNLSACTVENKLEQLFRVFETAKELDKEGEKMLIVALPVIFGENDEGANLYTWIDADRLVREALGATRPAFVKAICNEIFLPHISALLLQALDPMLGINGIAVVNEYTARNPAIKNAEKYPIFESISTFSAMSKRHDAAASFACIESIPSDKKFRESIAEYIRVCLLNRATQHPEQTVIFDIAIGYLRNGTALTDKAYLTYKNRYLDDTVVSKGEAKAVHDCACHAAKLLLKSLDIAAGTSTSMRDAICADKSTISAIISEFSADFGKNYGKWIVANLHLDCAEFRALVEEVSKISSTQSTGFFARIFKKR